MSKQQWMSRSAATMAAVMVSALAHAVDGQVLIDQNKVLAGAVTPGDAPGFPITITRSGSYKLSSNLIVPDANTTAIEIAASHVTIDLNGFAILGPTDCSGGLNPCAGAGSGVGITNTGLQFNIAVRNGTVQGMGGGGIHLSGDSHVVAHMNVRSNGGGAAGIRISPGSDLGPSVVEHCTVQRNGGLGISVFAGSVRHNVVNTNLSSGISVSVGSVEFNVVTRNLAGLNLGNGAGAQGNVMRDNTSGNFIGGGVNLGHNLCTGAGGTC